MVRNNVILSITPKVVLLFLCLYRYIRASTVSLVSVLNIWTPLCAKIDISKQLPSSFLRSCRNACEKLCAEQQEQIGSEETCPFAGTSNIPLPAHTRLEVKINDPLGFSISFDFLILQVQGSISLSSSLLVVKQPVSGEGSSGWQEMLFKNKVIHLSTKTSLKTIWVIPLTSSLYINATLALQDYLGQAHMVHKNFGPCPSTKSWAQQDY